MPKGQANQRKNQWVQRFIQLSSAPPADESNGRGAAPTYVEDLDVFLGGSSGPSEPQATSSEAAQQPVGVYVEDSVALRGNGPTPPRENGPAKSHEDPLRADPKIAALLDQRAEVERKMSELIAGDSQLDGVRTKVEELAKQVEQLEPDNNNYDEQRKQLETESQRLIETAVSGNKNLEKLGQEHETISAQLEQEVRRLNKQGVAPQRRGAEYQDEEKKVGWRADIWDGPHKNDARLKELFRESTHARTEYYDAAKRDEAELNVGLDGKLRTKDGSLRTDAEGENISEMVINPETGKMHEFKPAKNIIGEQGTDLRTGQEKPVLELRHHSSVLAGKEVTGAGSFETDSDGNLTKITNKSGHYKPGIAKLIQSVETLLRQGAFLDKSWEGGDNLAGREKQLFKFTKKAIKAASKLQIEVRQEALAMDRVLEQNPNANVDEQAKSIVAKSVELKKQLEAVAKAQRVLAKLGVSQRNQITGQVEFLDIGEGMTGVDVRLAQTKTQGVEKFLQSGGGSQSAADKKETMLEELEAKTSQRRQELDDEAEKTARHGSAELPYDVDDLLGEFSSLGFQAQDDASDQSAGSEESQVASAPVFSYRSTSPEDVGKEDESEENADVEIPYNTNGGEEIAEEDERETEEEKVFVYKTPINE